MNIVVYTAIFGTIDYLYAPLPTALGSAKWICFTDRERRETGLWSHDGIMEWPSLLDISRTSPFVPRWEQIVVEPKYDMRRTARYYKTLAHRHFPDADFSVWVDGNIRTLIKPEVLVAQHMPKGAIFATFEHPDRRCLYQEAAFCSSHGKGNRKRIAEQIAKYTNEGVPSTTGLFETKCVIRRHCNKVIEVNELWWEQIRDYSVRDQVSLPYVLWKANAPPTIIPGRAAVAGWPGKRNEQFWMVKHAAKK